MDESSLAPYLTSTMSLADVESLNLKYDCHEIAQNYGQIDLNIYCLKSLEATIDLMFEELSRQGKQELLDIYCPYFGVIWPSARTVADHLGSLDASEIEGKSVLEVGCGLAIPGLVAAKRGAKVTATDYHPAVAHFLSKNTTLNDIAIDYKVVDWRHSPEHLKGQTFDWIIGTDLLYDKENPEILARVLSEIATPKTRIMIGDPGRFYLHHFRNLMENYDFQLSATSKLGFLDRFGEKINILIYTRK
jgi:predicted nicotinamide N-methyase